MMSDNVIFAKSLPDAFAQAGMRFPDHPPELGKLSRFPTNNRRGDKAGWCKLFADGVGASFGCNRDGTTFTWQQRDSNAPPLSKEEHQAARAKSEQARQQAERDRAAEHARAADIAARILGKASQLDPAHGYVKRKGITPYCARQNCDGSITLPVHDAHGALQSLQFIRADGDKQFLYQGKMRGGRLFIGTPINGLPLVLVEGWATGCSIHEATGKSVVIGFSGSNMNNIAADLRRQFPESQLQVAGDLDAHGKGLKYAQAAAATGAGLVLMPLFADSRSRGDFNDLHQAEGLDKVRRQLEAASDRYFNELAPFLEPCLPKCDARDGTRDTRPLTEYGNAQRLFDANGDRLKYIHDAQSWIVWNGSAWQWDSGPCVRSMAAMLPSAIYAEGARHINDAEHYGKWARDSQKQRTINAAVSLLSDFAPARAPLARIDADQFTIGFNQARQVIDLRNGSTRAAAPSDYITKSLSAEAIGDLSKALRWVQFLEQVFEGDQELISWLQRFCGYLLTGSTREQIFLFCFGYGANGKSVFIEVLKHILGDYGRAIASETLSEGKRQAGAATPDLAALIGARLVLSSETEDNTALAESLVKSLVSGDCMAVRQLYAEPVQFMPTLKLVMVGNHKPIIRSNDNGIWRRVRLVPFNRTFSPEERDPHLLDTLKVETPHILAWMIDGCIEWQRRGLADTPASICQATGAYQVDQDLTGTWLNECTSSTAHDEVLFSALYANYKAWSLDNGLRPLSAVALGRRLSERGYRVRQSNGKSFRCGLSLIDSHHNDYARAKDGY